MISVRNVSFGYERGENILKNLEFTIKKGEFVALIGENGAGKTTLLKHLNGLLKPSTGSIFINSLNAARTKTSVLAKHIGFLFQNPDHQIFCSTVWDEVAFGLKNVGVSVNEIEDRVRKSAKMVGIEPLLRSNPFCLSKGQRQRVALASILAMETEILVLDEPTTGQDYNEGIEVMEIIRQLNHKGKTVIIVTHDMELVARYAKRVIILQNGKIVEDGPTKHVMSKVEKLELSNLQPPQIFELAKKFHKQGLFRDTFTQEEMFEEIISYLEGEENACNG